MTKLRHCVKGGPERRDSMPSLVEAPGAGQGNPRRTVWLLLIHPAARAWFKSPAPDLGRA